MSRPLNALEKKIHSECTSKANKIISQKEVDAVAPDAKPRVDAINFLLKAGMFVVLTDKNGTVSYRAVSKKELEVKKEISSDENIILQAIQAAKNEGIWTKHLKNTTNLHQTIITRTLKTLEQKGLIKPIKSVKNPTRKIYIMSHLEPSVEVTGGPWYTDHELDTEFIRMLLSAALRFITDRSFPKTDDDEARPLFPISQAPTYPSATNILSFLMKSRITEIVLGLDDMESLLDVLVYDGLVERLPAFGGMSWTMSMLRDDDDEDDDDDDEGASSSKKKKGKKSKEKAKDKKRRRSKRSDDESSEDERPKKRSKKSKRDSDSDEDSDDDAPKKKKSKSKKKKAVSDDEESDEDDSPKKSKKKKASSSSKKRKRESSESPSDSEEEAKRRSKKKRRARTPSSSESGSEDESDDDEGPVSRSGRKSAADTHSSAAHVYRAIRSELVEPLQAFSQAPCTKCPQFEFCESTGPVNAKGCEYFGQWLVPEF